MSGFLIRVLIYLLTSCFKVAPVQLPALKSEAFAPIPFTHSQPIDLGDSRCTYGGVLFETWTEQGKLDAIYTEGQDTDYSRLSIILCKFKNHA